ncbi:Putative protein of unknown function [Podospora comata]|uniref:PSP1 C-terminal domain-containing protein n=1 Tax=Podospora comata TaxID=48703 RepID=A0ABY6S7F2_PODCO|nr:Putative protein of unknown function [Podospora comata]
MSSGGGKTGPPPKQGQGPFSGVAPSSQAILLDKLGRRSTPDSEALASSDDEPEAFRQDNIPPTVQPPKPMRRASWLNDTTQQQPLRQRKESFASSSMSPTTSHPSTPAADPGASVWGASAGVLGRNHSGSGTFTWGNTGIWNTDRKEPPSRLTEVLPSPTSAAPPGGTASSFFGNDFTQTSPGPRETPNSQLPFPIPLHPTPKTYRSQSYSVGQLEPSESAMTAGVPSTIGSRVRPMGHSGLQHRPSRPSMLSEMANDSSLGKVNEDDDDDSTGSLQGSQHQEQAKTIEMLTRENMMLRQQQQFQNQARLRPRASTSSWGLGNGYFTQEPVPEESDYAIDEHDEANDGSEMAARRSLARRMSEYGPGTLRTPYLIENRKLENVKKGIWQSSLGFGGLGEPPQSRRHSFADVPTRQASISSISEAALEQASQDLSHSQEFSSAYNDNANFNTGNQVPSYFLSGNVASPAQQGLGQVGPYHNQYASPYGGMPGAYANRPISPHRGMYGVTQPRHTQSLYIVLFKCSRADVFYIQEGTGLSVKPGDLVIVEADRGTDLGTVAKDNVDWQTAKEYKEHYAEEQYRWLMMYSQNATSQDGAGAGLMAASNGLQGSAVGGMGPPSQNHMQEPNSGELKPKLIRRLAQPYEIQGLREKEGQEAKAKRVCQQKVKEHGLNMEILDAEFQGLEEAHILLLCRLIHQLQLSRHRPFQNLQNSHLDVGHQSGIFREPVPWSSGSERYWSWSGREPGPGDCRKTSGQPTRRPERLLGARSSRSSCTPGIYHPIRRTCSGSQPELPRNKLSIQPLFRLCEPGCSCWSHAVRARLGSGCGCLCECFSSRRRLCRSRTISTTPIHHTRSPGSSSAGSGTSGRLGWLFPGTLSQLSLGRFRRLCFTTPTPLYLYLLAAFRFPSALR